MTRLSDFKPLARLTLPGLDAIETSGLILVVGPNSSGKSQLLRDIYNRITGTPRTLVVAEDVQVSIPAVEPLVECLKSEGLFRTIYDDNGGSQLQPQTPYLGSGEPVPQIGQNQPMQWFKSYNAESPDYRRRSDFLAYFGRLLVTGLFLDRRLISVNQVGTYDFESQPPQHELHALYVDDPAREELFNEIRSSFGKAIWPDTSRGNVLCLKVSDEGVLPTADERLSPRKMVSYRSIESEGDGMKSYVATCIALLLGRRPVCLLDEPEMCLHPPQAYNLGRFIGRFGSSLETVTFAATHSSHVLRGVIQTAPKLQIVRLSRNGAGFKAHLVSADELNAVLVKPTVRAETVLDGIFAQAVVVLEADTDRTVYQATWETLHEEIRLDVHFAAVGGTGGIADTCQLYKTLQIPVAVIADLDLIADTAKLSRIASTLVPRDMLDGLIAKAEQVGAMVKLLPPTVSPEVLRKRIGDALNGPMDWQNGDDEKLRRLLSSSANELDRMRRIKSGGVAVLPEPLYGSIRGLLDELANFGLFLVPVGELEGWVSDIGVIASKTNKAAWANEAASRIRKAGAQPSDIWDFMRLVGGFLRSGPAPNPPGTLAQLGDAVHSGP